MACKASIHAPLMLLVMTGFTRSGLSQELHPVRAPIHLRLINAWNPLGAPPVLRLSLVTETTYPDTGYCLQAETSQSTQLLTVRLTGVRRCSSEIGMMVSPASWSTHFPYATQGDRQNVRITANGKTDIYTLSWGPGWATFAPYGPVSFTILDHGQMVQLIPPESLFIGCLPVLLPDGVCTALYTILQQRLKRDEIPYSVAFDVLAYRQEIDRKLPPPPNPGLGLVPVTPADLDTVLALTRTFTELFRGPKENYYRGFTQVRIRTWLGRELICMEGVCTETQ